MRSPGLAGRLSLPVVLLVVSSLALLGALTLAVTYHGSGAAAQSADLRMATVVRWLGVLLLAGAGAGALAGVLLSRSLTRPLRRLSEVAARLAGGDFTARAATGGGREIAAVSAAFNRMAEELQRSQGSFRFMFERNPLPMWVFDEDVILGCGQPHGSQGHNRPSARRRI